MVIPIGRAAVQGWGGVPYLWGSGDATFFIAGYVPARLSGLNHPITTTRASHHLWERSCAARWRGVAGRHRLASGRVQPVHRPAHRPA